MDHKTRARLHSITLHSANSDGRIKFHDGTMLQNTFIVVIAVVVVVVVAVVVKVEYNFRDNKMTFI